MRPTWVGLFKWQPRQTRSASPGLILAGFLMSAASVDSACLLPGPWHDSQALVSNLYFLSVSTAWWGFFWNAAKMSSWQPSQVSEPTYCAGVLSLGAGAEAGEGEGEGAPVLFWAPQRVAVNSVATTTATVRRAREGRGRGTKLPLGN